jgi:pimeloyl-ACP methyl ester carboxylesterase
MRVIRVLCLFFIINGLACAPVKIRTIDPADSLREFRQDILSSDKFSPLTTQTIRSFGLEQSDVLENGVAPKYYEHFAQFSDTADLNYVSSEVLIGRAQKVERRDPVKAVGFYLLAADLASQGFFLAECRYPLDIRCDSFKVFYDRAVRGIVSYLNEHKWNDEAIRELQTSLGRRFSFSLSSSTKYENPREYDVIIPSGSVGLEGLTNRYRRTGVGVSLTACRARRDSSKQEQYLPRVGVCLPLTAVLRYPDGGCKGESCPVTLEVHNVIVAETTTINGHKLPLAADFSAPFAQMIDRTQMGAWQGLFSALQGNEELLKDTGFYTVEPYNSGKIPLITVHGLFSNPLTWMDLHNDLMGDAVIREHFQVWHYLYPTNLPIIENQKTFREKLDELYAYLTAQSPHGKPVPKMVIVGHSMGGILTHTAVATDSEELKKYFFENIKKLEELDTESREELSKYVDFQAKPYVRRAIFVAVPHRGSDIADNWIGRIGRALITLPKTILTKSAALTRSVRNIVRPDLQTEFDAGEPSSIKSLSKKNPGLVGISMLPIDPRIPFHSIIGDRGRGDTPTSSDGVVEYSSSHLDGAVSELIVPADHTAHAHPLAVQEIRRILHLDLKERPGMTMRAPSSGR